MADLLDLFSPALPDTPFFDGTAEADVAEPSGPEPALVPPVRHAPPAAPRRVPYPVVLGPVPSAPPAPEPDPFSEVDLHPAPAARDGRPRCRRRSRWAEAAAVHRPVLDGDTPLLEAARAMLAYAVAAFDGQADAVPGHPARPPTRAACWSPPTRSG